MPKPIRALIVDDEPDIRRLYKEVLGLAEDFEVVGLAANGAEAIVEAANAQPDVVLLDVMMPVLDGIVALPGIRWVAPASKVAIFTAVEVRLLNSARIEQAGADAVLLKTLSPTALLEELRRIAHRRPGGSP